uniref:DUF4456 domain-containing protein n=1 Tax=Schistocephalus solidus TaxID=70667 RepID=A0A183TCH8_SCHSO
LGQTGQTSHDVVPDGKGNTSVTLFCLWSTAPEKGLAGTHLLYLTLLSESGLAALKEHFWDFLYYTQDLTPNLKSCWNTLRRLALATEFHVKMAAQYHQFHYKRAAIEEKQEQIFACIVADMESKEWLDCRSTPLSIRRFADVLQTILDQMEHLHASIDNLLEEFRSTSPIYTRIQPLIEPVRGVMLCDYFTKTVSLREDQEVLVLSNGIAKPMPSTSREDSSCSCRCSPCLSCSGCCSLTSSCDMHHETQSYPWSESTTRSPIQTEESAESLQSISTEVSCGITSCCTNSDTTTASADVTRYTWLVKTMDKGIEAEVPGVCVALTEIDYSAVEQITGMYEEFSTFWKRIIDGMLLTGMKMFSSFFETLLTREVVWTEDFRLFDDFLDELDHALIEPPDLTVNATVNEVVREQIYVLRSRCIAWRQGR